MIESIIHYFIQRRAKKDPEFLVRIMQKLHKEGTIDYDERLMIEGALKISSLNIRDIMVPSAQMITIHNQASLKEILPIITESQHSRFPVIGDQPDDIKGILLAKRLLSCIHDPHSFQLSQYIHPVSTVPETKRTDHLLRELRGSHSHMAIVVDEYSCISGLVTIEDIVEEIIGEIEDESFTPDREQFIKKVDQNKYIINTKIPLSEFNTYFNVSLEQDQCSTLAGFILLNQGYIPKNGETLTIDNLEITILHADPRRLRLIELKINES